MTKNIKNDDRGLTLLELIIGVVILAIIITPLLHTLITGANSTMKAKRYNDATIAAQNIAEEIGATDMADYLDGVAFDEHGNYHISTGTSSGGTAFDAVITIEPTAAAIPVSSSMDAQLNMNSADADAFTQLRGEAEALNGTFGKLSRTITLNVADIEEESGAAGNATVLFEYSSTIAYADEDGNTQHAPFSYTARQSKNVSTAGGKGFSVFLFYNAAPGPFVSSTGEGATAVTSTATVSTGIMSVNNATAASFNFYLININAEGKYLDADNAKPRVYYYPDKSTSMSLMTNIFPSSGLSSTTKADVTYKSFVAGSHTWMSSKTVPAGLMKTTTVECLFAVTVDIYRDGEAPQPGDEDPVSPVFSLKTEKLDYSMQ